MYSLGYDLAFMQGFVCNMLCIILCPRCFFLDRIWEKLCSSPANSMEVDGAEQESTAAELGALVKDCKFNMKLNMADSAWKQVHLKIM